MAKCGLCGVDVTFDMMQYYVPDFNGQKHRVCKRCSVSAQDKALKFDPASGKIVVVEKSEIEIRKKCNVCGHVFCYNPVDLDNNKKKQSQAMWSAVGSLGGAMSGHYAASAIHQNNSNQAMGGIVDYNKCPQCGSMDLKVLGKEEQISNNQAQQFSAADELKKYKELLDAGVLTQEEFDQKKNEFLHGVAPQSTAPVAPETSEQTVETQAQIVEQNQTDTNTTPLNWPKILFWVITGWGVFKGYKEIYNATRGFKAVYRGIWEPVVGHEEVVSALLAAVIWIILAVFFGFIAGRIASKIQKKIRQ